MVSSIRCEQGAKSPDGLDVWLSRGAMLGFTAAITFELATGKGVLEVPFLIELFRKKFFYQFKLATSIFNFG